MNYLLKFSYDGTNYNGFQKQPNFRTIQEEIEKALSIIFNTQIKIIGSGRTDSKVHALNQYANFLNEKIIKTKELKYKLNCLLPNDIYIKNIKKVNDDFNARYNAIEKVYEIRINNKEHDPFLNNYVIDSFYNTSIKKMREISKLFIGEKCFINFTSKEVDFKKYIRSVNKISINKKNGIIKIRFYGNGFMRYQVRMMSANILLYGQNKITKTEIENKLKNIDVRNITPYCLKANGLYLINVKYKKR